MMLEYIPTKEQDMDISMKALDRKSTLGGIFIIGSTTILWYNKTQRSIALSSLEADYMATSQAAYVPICMRKILVGLFG